MSLSHPQAYKLSREKKKKKKILDGYGFIDSGQAVDTGN
jgi:hypothetical protein